MKKNLFFFLLLPFMCCAQEAAPVYYDWEWKPCDVSLARFIALQKKTDSGWLRSDYYLSNNTLQMTGLFADSACKIQNGWFRYFYSTGFVSSEGQYVNGKREGNWLSFHTNGVMKDSAFYINDKRTGIAMGWHNNGYMSDSSFYNADGTSVSVGWYDNGNPSYAGRFFKNKPQGKVQYFHKNGSMAALEKWEQDKLVEAVYYDEAGKELTAPLYKTADAEFTGGNKKWRDYLEKKLQFPNGYKLVNTNLVTVVIEALIDEDGNVTEAWVHIPFKPVFDAEALRVVKKSPKWVPAASHNRKVRMYIRQPVSFAQVEE
jgi:antitoxin component YwqK of YwqJK toxin-antitoxin module